MQFVDFYAIVSYNIIYIKDFVCNDNIENIDFSFQADLNTSYLE